MAQCTSSCNKHSYKSYIMHKGKNHANDFIMVKGAVEFTWRYSLSSQRFLGFCKLVKTVHFVY